MKKYVLILILLSLISLWPFFKKGYFESHDGEWMVIRFSAFHQALRAEQFPVRFVDRLNNNYGYPVFNFLYPLPFYFAEVPKIAGFGFVNSIKIIFITSTLISAIAMFWALSRKYLPYASLLGSLIYIYAPYRFLDLYVRGSLGEIVALAFLPLILGSIFEIQKGKKIFVPALSIFSAGLIMSHNVIAFLFLPLFLFISLTLSKNTAFKVFAAIITGLLLSTFFWLPAIFEIKLVRLSQLNVSDPQIHLVSIAKLIWSKWGYAASPNSSTGLSPQIGIMAFAIFVAAFLLSLIKREKQLLIWFLIIVYLLAVFLMTKQSSLIWTSSTFLTKTIQFPWRLLSTVVFVSAILASHLAHEIRFKYFSIPLVILLVATTISYTKPIKFVDKGDSYYATNEDTTTVQDEYLPLRVTEKSAKRADEKIEIESGMIENKITKAANYKATIDVQNKTLVKVNTVYFPGWQVKDNNTNLNIDYSNAKGLITFYLSPGIHQVIISYGRSKLHLISELISALTFILFAFYSYKQWQNKNS